LPLGADSAILAGMTVEQLKAEAAKLPPGDRYALAEWIEENEDVRALRHQSLVQEIELGLEQADRGDLLEADEVFARLRALPELGR
jgi:predicted transcriptional regulator